MLRDLRNLYAEELSGVSDAELRELIATGTERAEGYGVVAESDVERFCELCIQYGPGFEHQAEQAWMLGILQDESLDGTTKMNRINELEPHMAS